jgi:hypothetical protein
MDEGIRAHPDDPVDCGKEIIVDEVLAQVHSGLRIDPVKRR